MDIQDVRAGNESWLTVVEMDDAGGDCCAGVSLVLSLSLVGNVVSVVNHESQSHCRWVPRGERFLEVKMLATCMSPRVRTRFRGRNFPY
jgi:hypothetical protein